MQHPSAWINRQTKARRLADFMVANVGPGTAWNMTPDEIADQAARFDDVDWSRTASWAGQSAPSAATVRLILRHLRHLPVNVTYLEADERPVRTGDYLAPVIDMEHRR